MTPTELRRVMGATLAHQTECAGHMTVLPDPSAEKRMMHEPVSSRTPEGSHDSEYARVYRNPRQLARKQRDVHPEIVAAIRHRDQRHGNPLRVHRTLRLRSRRMETLGFL